MDWNALALVAIGGLIDIIGSFFNNWFQAKERDKDRQEQRRDAKIQAREKWTERDMLRIMELLENMMTLLYEDQNIEFAQTLLEEKRHNLTEEQYMSEGNSLVTKSFDRLGETDKILDTIARLVYSFGEGDVAAGSFQQALREELISISEMES